MKRWIRRGLLALLALTAVAAVAITLALRASLPALDGEAPLARLSAPAVVQRDALGVVTIDANDQRDAMRALGYVHAQERFFEMDLLRRSAAGELSALFGPRALDHDRRHRIHRLRARATRDIAALPPEHRAVLEAYVEGVNAGLQALDARPWPYLLLRKQPAPWQPADTLLSGHAMYFDLQFAENPHELAMARIRPHVPPALFALLTHDGTSWDAPLIGSVRGDAVLPGPGVLDLRRLPAPSKGRREKREDALAPGSNNFAVAGSLTRDGRAIVADDMHLGLRAPNIWFRARLRYADRRAPDGRVDVTGFTLPGIPGVVVGSNGHVAWGFTNSYIDTVDWARQRPCTGDGPRADCVPVRVQHEHIDVSGGESSTLDVRETDWGPVLHDEPDGHVLALRWTAHLPGSLNLVLLEMARARSLEEASEVATRARIPTQNLVFGDRSGQVAWRWIGGVPQRAPECMQLYTWTAERCPPWHYAPADALPPPLVAERVWTANSRVVDGDALRLAGDGGSVLGARAKQIRDALMARDRFDERDLLAIQLDDRALFLERWWRLLRDDAARARTPALRELAAAAARWEGRAAPESVSYRIVRAWRLAVHERIADGFLAPAKAALGDDFKTPSMPQFEGVVWPLLTQRPAHLLPPGFDSWEALLEDAAVEVRDELTRTGPLAQRTWGERNTAAICHPLAGAIPLIGRRMLCMPPDPLPGDTSMPRVQGPAMGASQRMVVSPGREAEGIVHMPGGQSGHPLSPFWGAGHDAWVRGLPTPFLPGETHHTLRLVPGR